MAKQIFFNSSLPRSGSTLLQNILAQNTRFYCSPTSGVFELLFAARMNFTEGAEFKAQDRDVMKAGFLAFCCRGVEGFYDAVTDRPICFDKSRAWIHYYEWLDSFYPNPKIIVCIRDIRSILSSMEKLFRKNKHLADPNDNPAKMNMTTVHNRVLHWLNTPPVGLALTRLNDAIQTGVSKHFHFVKFEDLTTHPKQTMQKIYDYIGETWFEHNFDHVEQATREDDAQYPIYGDHTIRSRVEPVPNDSLAVLGKEICNAVKADNWLFFNAFYPNA